MVALKKKMKRGNEASDPAEGDLHKLESDGATKLPTVETIDN